MVHLTDLLTVDALVDAGFVAGTKSVNTMRGTVNGVKYVALMNESCETIQALIKDVELTNTLK